MSVIAELKTACSTATKAGSIERDLLKLLAVARYTKGWEQRPRLFFIAAPGPDERTADRIRTDVEIATARLRGMWPHEKEPEIIMRPD